MEFSPRLRHILMLLLNADEIVSASQLAENIHVSKRTIQRELAYVDGTLKKYQISLNKKTGRGIWLEGTVENKQKLLGQLLTEDSSDSTDKEERRKRLILEMLKDRSPKKLYHYSNLFQVSETTISSDMDMIKQWFANYGLILIRKQGYGVELAGSEKDYRRAVRMFLEENIDRQVIKAIVQEKSLDIDEIVDKEKSRGIYRLLDQHILEQVIFCLFSIQDQRISKMTDSSYIGLVFHVTIAVIRILKKEIIEANQDFLNKLIKDSEYDLAINIADTLAVHFQIHIPDVEIAYLYLHLKGAKYQTVDMEDFGLEEPENKDQLLVLINRMIDRYDPLLAFELKQDEEFVTGLLAHLQPTLVRLNNHMLISNPLLVQIMENDQEIYDKCLAVGMLLEETFGVSVPEAEIGFLALHFGAAMVRLEQDKESERRVIIGIVCASGIGISRLMLSKIKRVLKDQAELCTYGKEDLTEFVLEKTDFFISSTQLDLSDQEVLMVSPLLADHDMEQIKSKTSEYARKPSKQVNKTEFSDQLEQINYTAKQIKTMMKEFNCIRVDEKISFDELLITVSEELSRSKEKGSIIVKDLKLRESVATQVIPEYGFALLHARTDGVTNATFSVCLAKNNDMFTNPYFQRIFAVIVMLMPRNGYVQENKRILSYLSGRLIESESFLTIILDGDKEAIAEALTKELKRYFNHYLDSFH